MPYPSSSLYPSGTLYPDGAGALLSGTAAGTGTATAALSGPALAAPAGLTGIALPLDLYAEVQTPQGVRYRWGPNEPPTHRLKNLSFRTKVGEGFSDASGQLSRRIDLDYPDLDLANSVSIIGADGSIAYEGRMAAMPREVGDSHSIGVTLAGWMAHAKDRKFTEIYVDRDLSAWSAIPQGRKIGLLTTSHTPIDPEQSVDTANSEAGVTTVVSGLWASPYIPVGEAWYDAGPNNTIAAISYSWKRESATIVGVAPWTWSVQTSSDDQATATVTGGNLVAAGPSTQQTFFPTSFYRYAYLQSYYNGTPAGADGARYGIVWYKLAVYGRHGLPGYNGEPGEPTGVRASDVIKNIVSRWCPMLSTAGVTDTTYVIQHLTFKESTFPYDALLEVNKYHLWHLGVWDNRTLYFRPYDLTDYKWEIRTDDPGTSFSPQGPSVDDIFNGIAVRYTDVLTGAVNRITPDDDSTLLDTSDDNPWNRMGVDHWDELELSSPTLQSQAVQIGRAALGERNRPKAPGSIKVTGYIRDREGVRQPAWKVRAGDTIAITNFPNDAPRLIVETDYNDADKTINLAVDSPFQLLDAYFDRLANALGARGLG